MYQFDEEKHTNHTKQCNKMTIIHHFCHMERSILVASLELY